ncbi:hypothetical protein [Caenimonas koreensis]|uniref:hypothetical protein n=1 Tax=Caenimonas koreensis TaxID=367474 RepID=UPI00188EBBB7|nr:hypothetical protein [Caenimonas koreensis]
MALTSAGEKKSFAQRKKELDETYKDWFAEQNALVEKYGIPLEEFVPGKRLDAVRDLDGPVASLKHEASLLVHALDAVVSGV